VNIINANDAETTKYNNDSVEALSMAIATLKKEIPKPISIENGFVKCGGCEKYIRFPIADRYNYCPECGQAIQWLDMSRFEKANKIVFPAIKFENVEGGGE
jgi:hypothetical protein